MTTHELSSLIIFQNVICDSNPFPPPYPTPDKKKCSYGCIAYF